MRRGLIINNAYSALASALNQSLRLKEELARLGVAADILNGAPELFIDGGGNISAQISGYDFCVYLDKDKYASRMLEKSGLRLFNSAAAVEICDDKMSTHIALANRGVPMPETVAGLLCYNPSAKLKQEFVNGLEKKLGYPLIVKESYGSLGKGVYKADNREQLDSLCKKLMCVPHLFQKFIKESAGRDLRVIVVGGRCVAAMRRVSNGDFRSNLELGGSGSPADICEITQNLCVRTAEALGLDYCGIDLLYGERGMLVCEVNSNAFFGGIEKVTGVNVAAAYAGYIVKEIYK